VGIEPAMGWNVFRQFYGDLMRVELEVLDCGVRISDFFRISEVEFRISISLHPFFSLACNAPVLGIVQEQSLPKLPIKGSIALETRLNESSAVQSGAAKPQHTAVDFRGR
jgi:hypothetical protein